MALNLKIFCVLLFIGNSRAFLHEIRRGNLTLKLSDGLSTDLNDPKEAGWTFLKPNKTIISTLHHQLVLECKSSFPIRWNITGYLSHPEILRVLPNERTFFSHSTFAFKLETTIFFSFDPKISAGALTVACENSDSYHDSIAIDIFVPNANRKMLFANKTNIQILEDTDVIPCAITDPREKIILNKDGKQILTDEIDVEYNPRHGFKSADIFPTGKYVCKSDEAEQSFEVSKTEFPSDFMILPMKKKIKQFSSTMVDIKCAPKHSTASASLQVDFPLRLSETNGTSKVYALESDVKRYTIVQGHVQCISEEKKVIWEWEIIFVSEPILFLDNLESEVNCISDTDTDRFNISRAVSTINCYNEDECKFLEHCFLNYESCNNRRQIQFFSHEQNICSGPGSLSRKRCSLVPFAHSKGIIECNVFGLAKRFMFHNSLGRQKYELNDQKGSHNMLRMEDVERILYVNITSTFSCEGVAFLYADSIIFEILYKNGTSSILHETSNSHDPQGLLVFGENVIGFVSVNLSVDAVGVRCIAPLMYSADYHTVEKQFETKYLFEPQMQQESQNISISSERRRLNCSAIAEPPATYQWRKNKQSLSNDDLYLITTGVFGESLLEFLKIDDTILGEYTCEASNHVLISSSEADVYWKTVNKTSSAWTTFTVTEALSEQGSSKTTILTSIAACASAIFCVLACCYAHRYRINANLMLRELTDAEIEEFYNGSMSVGENEYKKGLDVQIIPHLQYDRKYEINISEIDLERTALLGEGNFSVVCKGNWKSSGSFVAVKMSKSTADVVVFKAFLAEIKIMIYIGKHENILCLLGASTNNIKDRKLHIVFELCESGSLQNFLLSNKDTFINLFDEGMDQQCHRSLQSGQQNHLNYQNAGQQNHLNYQNAGPQNHMNYQNAGPQITTINLLQWCEQICCAMEYLSIKNEQKFLKGTYSLSVQIYGIDIVHGDLAARNVLLSADLTCKVADFGLSKQLYDNQAYTKQSKLPLPWRWMALESLQSLTFSTQSDIWSFGVTMWEIFSLGNVPYPNDTWNTDFVAMLSSGLRIGKPKFANHEIYANIAACWDEAPNLRPPFSKQRKFFMDFHRSFNYSKPE